MNLSDTYTAILDRMKEKFTELTGMDADEASDISIRMKLLAGEVFSLSAEIDWIKQQMFPHTATGEMLDLHAQQRGLQRNKGQKAKGMVVFMLEMPLEYTFVVPEGTVCTVEDGSLRFVTTEPGRIERGSTTVWVNCEAEHSGEQYNVENTLVNTIVTYLSVGIRINNSSAFNGGTNDEDDASLRERLIQSYRDTPDGVNASFFRSLAESVEGVQSANIFRLADTPAWVGIVLAGRGEPVSAEAMSEARTLLNSHAPIGINLLIENTGLLNYNVSVSIAVKSGYRFETVQQNVMQVIRNFMLNLKVAESVYLTALGKAVLEAEGVENYAFGASMQDTTPLGSQLLVLNQLTVSEMT